MLRYAILSLALASCASTPAPVATSHAPHTLVALPAIAATALDAPAAPAELIASADGRTTTLPRACTPDPSPADDRVFACTSTPEWPRRQWSFEGAGRVIDVREEMALVARDHTLRMALRNEDAGARAPEADGAVVHSEVVMLFEIDRARWITPQLVEPTADWVRVGFTADGEVLGLARTGHGPGAATWIVHGPTRDFLQMTPIDRAADDIARTASGDFVVTVGERAYVIGREGLSARPITLPAGAALEPPAPASGPRRAGERVRCVGQRCTLDNRATVTVADDRSVP